MIVHSAISSKDKQYIWHPFTPLVGSEPALPITKAQGVYLYTEDGQKILDGIASWWVNLHGHSHPKIAEAIYEQAQTLEHIIFAGFTHKPATELAERLLAILPQNQKKVFYSDDGSTACEVALKMALQYWYNQGIKKNKIIALEGAYHGDTFGAMSVGSRNPFNAPFQEKLFDVEFLPFPTCYQGGCCGGTRSTEKCISVGQTLKKMEELAASGEVAAFIYEPLVQGAAGMRMYSVEILDALLEIAKKHNILCIADEVMTGFGRTGKLFASEYCTNKPDIMCLSKGITGGFMALGATTCTEEVISVFRSPESSKTFYHGHSFTANPIACAAALASMDLLIHKDCIKAINQIEQSHIRFESKIAKHKAIKNIRSIGTILAIELKNSEESSYFNSIGKEVYQFFLEKNMLLRPLGNVVYVMPPYIILQEELQQIYEAIEELLSQYS
ncbi:adenosylmethionine-8-amino-7-oxononanoate aminotransferase [bacterium 336/3]|nr:adenosylmethionine-8-amino-7-oxononanoate aminotransferase [bacterium 336/3]